MVPYQEARASFVMDHGRFGPQGALRGHDGDVNKVVVLRDENSHPPKYLSGKQDIAPKPVDHVWVSAPSGGG